MVRLMHSTTRYPSRGVRRIGLIAAIAGLGALLGGCLEGRILLDVKADGESGVIIDAKGAPEFKEVLDLVPAVMAMAPNPLVRSGGDKPGCEAVVVAATSDPSAPPIACTFASASASLNSFCKPARTACFSAFTGGLSTVITAIAPSRRSVTGSLTLYFPWRFLLPASVADFCRAASRSPLKTLLQRPKGISAMRNIVLHS